MANPNIGANPGNTLEDTLAGQGGIDVQAFYGGAGTYTWTKPATAKWVDVLIISAGGGGGSGGYDTSDSGGGGGAGGGVAYVALPASILNATEDVIIGAGGVGGVAKAAAGDGNTGGQPGETSFGAAARNLARMQPTVAVSGGGGTNAAGVAGTALALASYTTCKMQNGSVGAAAGAGDDTANGADGGSATCASGTSFLLYRGSGGGGGGGTNGGANFTNGGAGGIVQNLLSQTQIAASAGGTADAAVGADGVPVTFSYAGAICPMICAAGTGGGGGAGAVVANANGGQGGAGGTPGGGGGGGGACKAGAANHSGAGGKGGDGAVIVISY